MKRILYISLILFLAIIFLNSCSGSGQNSGLTSFSTISTPPDETPTNAQGKLEIGILWPQKPTNEKKLIPPETESVVFKISGQGITGEREYSFPYGTNPALIEDLPDGIKTAKVKAIDGNGTTLTHRIVDFNMESGKTTKLQIELGITITDEGFIPQNIKIRPNDTLMWLNSGQDNHSVISDTNAFDSNSIEPGKKFSKKFTSAGVYEYHDGFDVSKRGKITVYAPPCITDVSPKEGKAGETVTITGINFGDNIENSVITFNGVSSVVISWSPTQIVCNIPQALSGNIVIIANNQSSNCYPFTITSPYISAVSPLSGTIGSQVTIQGSGFGQNRGNSRVVFNSVDAVNYISWNSNEIICIIPEGAQTGPISVNIDNATSNNIMFSVLPNEYFGNGNDGAITISGEFNINTQTNQNQGRVEPDAVNFSVTSNISAGQKDILLSEVPNGLTIGDEILIINLKSQNSPESAGIYETCKIKSLNGNTITCEQNLANSYNGTNSKILVQRVPNYTNITINNGGKLTATAWNTNKGGVIFIRCRDKLILENGGRMTVSLKGFSGGISGLNPPEKFNGLALGGENGSDSSTLHSGANGGNGNCTGGPNGGNGAAGGGWGSIGISGLGGTLCGGGGGAGGYYGATGGGGSSYQGGNQPSDSNCIKVYLGGGGSAGSGGGGKGDTGFGGNKNGLGGIFTGSHWSYSSGSNGTNGEAGGGIIIIYAGSIEIQDGAKIEANGGTGGSGGRGGGEGWGRAGGGSGGWGASGGVISLNYSNISNNGAITANGGNGGNGGKGGNNADAGNGGNGGIFNESGPATGTTGSGSGTYDPGGGGGSGGPAGEAGVIYLKKI